MLKTGLPIRPNPASGSQRVGSERVEPGFSAAPIGRNRTFSRRPDGVIESLLVVPIAHRAGPNGLASCAKPTPTTASL